MLKKSIIRKVAFMLLILVAMGVTQLPVAFAEDENCPWSTEPEISILEDENCPWGNPQPMGY